MCFYGSTKARVWTQAKPGEYGEEIGWGQSQGVACAVGVLSWHSNAVGGVIHKPMYSCLRVCCNVLFFATSTPTPSFSAPTHPPVTIQVTSQLFLVDSICLVSPLAFDGFCHTIATAKFHRSM